MEVFRQETKQLMKQYSKVKEQWERIKNDGINQRELRDAQTYYKGSFSRNFTSTISLASLLKLFNIIILVMITLKKDQKLLIT